jgi:hypothetical protein
MKFRPSNPQSDRVAELKLMVIRQQELAAKLFRKGQHDKARQARDKLLILLNQLEIHQGIAHNPSATASSIERTTA